MVEALSPAERERVELIWLDIQGYEQMFFEGATLLERTPVPVVSELWPYGLLRAGATPESYTRQIGRYFRSWCVVDDADWSFRPVEEIGALFDRYAHPRQACSILLLPVACADGKLLERAVETGGSAPERR